MTELFFFTWLLDLAIRGLAYFNLRNAVSRGLKMEGLSVLSINDRERRPSAVFLEEFHKATGHEIFVHKWNEAVAECRSCLIHSDQMSLAEFGSPEALLEDLHRKALKQEDKLHIRKAITELKLPLETMNKVSQLLILAIRPSSLEISILWGFLSLIVQLSLEAESRWVEMNKTLAKTTRTLQRCAAAAHTDFVDNEEFKDNLLAIFIALIKFWAQASKWMRDNPIRKTATSYLSTTFKTTMDEIEDATNTMEHCYSTRLSGRRQSTISRNVEPPKIVSPATPTQVVTFPHRQLPHNNVEHFVGRAQIMTKIHKILHPEEGEDTHHLTLWGLGGVGKSQCALAYAEQFGESFDAMFWVRAENETSLSQSFSSLALHLGLTTASSGERPDQIRDRVHYWLRTCNRPWLMIFDNVEDLDTIQESLPTSPGSVLITTRYTQIAATTRGGVESKIQLKPFRNSEDWDLFSNMLTGHHKKWMANRPVPDEERVAAEGLLLRLGGLPLAVRQVAALIRRKGMDVAKFYKWYSRESGDIKKILGGRKFKFDGDYPYGVETVWSISFNELQNRNRGEDDNDDHSDYFEENDAYSLLATLSFLSPDSIPTELFKHECGDVTFCGDEDLYVLENPKEDLLQLALIDAEHDTLSVHRLVQTTFLHRLEDHELETAFKTASYLLNAVFPKRVNGIALIPQWATCIKYAPHVQALMQRYEEYRSKLSPLDDFLEVLSHCSWYFHESGDTTACIRMARLAISACPDKESLVCAHLQNTMGACSFEINDLETARASLEKAEVTRRALLPPDNQDLLGTLHNYANLLSSSGDLEAALKAYNEIEKIREQPGFAKIPLCLTYFGTGQVLVQMERYDEAASYYDKLYEILVKEVGPMGHYIPDYLYLYGNLKLAQNKTHSALDYYKKGNELYKDKRLILTSCFQYKIGVIMLQQGNLVEARDYLQSALDLSKQLKSQENVARISRRLWPLLATVYDPEVQEQSMALRAMSDIWERKIVKTHGEIEDEKVMDEHFDKLMCLFFR